MRIGDKALARVFCRNFCGTITAIDESKATILGAYYSNEQARSFMATGEEAVAPTESETFHPGNMWTAPEAS